MVLLKIKLSLYLLFYMYGMYIHFVNSVYKVASSELIFLAKERKKTFPSCPKVLLYIYYFLNAQNFGTRMHWYTFMLYIIINC